eukprot:g5543.t1
MVNFTFSATLPLPADVYFLERDTEAFRRLQGKLLKLGTLDIVDFWRQNETSGVVRLVTKPNARKYIPESVRRRLSFIDISFEDYLEYHTELVSGPNYELIFRSVPPVFQDRINITGRLRIEPIDDDNCLQTIEGTVDIRLFGLKRLVESIIVESVGKSYRLLPKVLYQWIRLREEILKHGGLEELMTGAPDLDWLPNAKNRKQRSLNYHSPLLNKTMESIYDSGLSWSETSGVENESSVHEEQEEANEISNSSTPVHSVRSSNYSDRTKTISEYESSVQFFDALEYLATETSHSWSSPVSSIHEHVPDSSLSEQPSFSAGKCSRRKLLNGCGLIQPIDGTDNQDEIIRKNSVSFQDPKPPVLTTGPVGTGELLKATGKFSCCNFRKTFQRRSDETKQRCLCLSVF